MGTNSNLGRLAAGAAGMTTFASRDVGRSVWNLLNQVPAFLREDLLNLSCIFWGILSELG